MSATGSRRWMQEVSVGDRHPACGILLDFFSKRNIIHPVLRPLTNSASVHPRRSPGIDHISQNRKNLNTAPCSLSNLFFHCDKRDAAYTQGRKGVTRREKDQCNYRSPCSHCGFCICRVPETGGAETCRTVGHDVNRDFDGDDHGTRSEIAAGRADNKGLPAGSEGLFLFPGPAKVTRFVRTILVPVRSSRSCQHRPF